MGGGNKALQPIRVAPHFFQRAAVLDGLEEHVGHRLHQMNVIDGESASPESVRAKHAESSVFRANRHRHAACHPAVAEQRGRLKSLFGRKIIHNDRLPGQQCVAGLRARAGAHRCTAQ